LVRKKTAVRARTAAVAAVVPTAVPVDMGKKVSVKVKSSSADEIVYTLSDGTKLTLRPVLMNIERSLNKFNPLGDPIYQLGTGLVMQTVVPKKLKRKGLK
jgi:hypothetical protein